MSTIKALAFALGVTVGSAVLLTIAHGLPTREQFLEGSVTMFAVAFVALKFFVGANMRRDRGEE